MSQKEKAVHSPADWNKLCALTDELAPEFGSRPAAFREACRRMPECNATPPSGIAIVKSHSKPEGQESTEPDKQLPEGVTKARPWCEVFRAAGIETKPEAGKKPAGARPWAEILQEQGSTKQKE